MIKNNERDPSENVLCLPFLEQKIDKRRKLKEAEISQGPEFKHMGNENC